MLFDYETSLDERLHHFSLCEDKADVVSSLRFTYVTTSSRDVGEYLAGIARRADEDVYTRFSAASILTEHVDRYIDMSRTGYALINDLCDGDSHLQFRHSLIMYMTRSGSHLFQTTQRLRKEINSENIPENKKYSFALRVEDEPIPQARKTYFAARVLPYFLRDECMDGIMAAQRIVSMCKEKYDQLFVRACLYLLDICYTSTSTNNRADAADVLLTSKDDVLVSLGRDVIDTLAGSDMYHASEQNVHMSSIEASCANNLERLLAVQVDVKEYDESVASFVEQCTPSPSLTLALERVDKDRARHTTYNVTLAFVFCRVWAYIQKSSHARVLGVRLYEELVDGAGLCSSGFLARMINSLSGYDGFGVGVSFEDQVYAYFSKKLEELIRDSECSDELLDELTKSTSGQVGDNLRTFIQKNIYEIRTYLEKEFRGYISDADIELYFKRAYVKYFD
jgi:hypothetical protein